MPRPHPSHHPDLHRSRSPKAKANLSQRRGRSSIIRPRKRKKKRKMPMRRVPRLRLLHPTVNQSLPRSKLSSIYKWPKRKMKASTGTSSSTAAIPRPRTLDVSVSIQMRVKRSWPVLLRFAKASQGTLNNNKGRPHVGLHPLPSTSST